MTFAVWAVVIILAAIWLGTWVLQIALIVLDLAITAIVWTAALAIGLLWLGSRAISERIRPA
ncbi:hypothetical protein [Brevundimonas sp.]|jgi:hypothetical protein|uniref:hypothetical protein n=1 Tax=Brevundimonas sp. TaxID=1871086 RepID=UPI003782F0E4